VRVPTKVAMTNYGWRSEAAIVGFARLAQRMLSPKEDRDASKPFGATGQNSTGATKEGRKGRWLSPASAQPSAGITRDVIDCSRPSCSPAFDLRPGRRSSTPAQRLA
jgi:hypothetical protein